MVWETLIDWFAQAQQALYEGMVQPVMFAAGMANLMEDAYEATGWLLVGLLQLLFMLLCIAPLQKWMPVEPVTDRKAIRVDVLYTLVHRLGVFRVALFFLVQPLWDGLFGKMAVWGVPRLHMDNLWPGVTDVAWVSFILYLLLFDVVDYWIHRKQHDWHWWWKLHSLHHSQRQMTMWSDNRNHLLDDLIRDCIIVVVAQVVGVLPAQFVLLVALTQLSESFHHANVRIWFGKLGERLWISPRFHRRHHTIGIGHEAQVTVRNRRARGNNFGVLLPWWDMLWGTANFDLRWDPTGIRDQVEPSAHGKVRDYGQGFWSQQWKGVLRLFNRA